MGSLDYGIHFIPHGVQLAHMFLQGYFDVLLLIVRLNGKHYDGHDGAQATIQVGVVIEGFVAELGDQRISDRVLFSEWVQPIQESSFWLIIQHSDHVAVAP